MANKILGVQVQGTTIAEIQSRIQKAEDLGRQGIWMTAGGASLDSMTCLTGTAFARRAPIERYFRDARAGLVMGMATDVAYQAMSL